MNKNVEDLPVVNSVKDEENTSIGTTESLNEQDVSIENKKNDKKFEFINQSTQDWPQWSVENKQQENEPYLQFENKENLEKNITKFFVKYNKYMYNRGMTGAIRTKILSAIGAQANKIKQENENRPQNQKLKVMQQVDRRLKGWRKKFLDRSQYQ